VRSFERNDTALVKVSPDGVTFTTVQEFAPADSDDTYHFVDINLSDLGVPMTSAFQILFDAAMSSDTDSWFLDDIQISGVR
jgi:hypothetical protein